MAQGDDFLRNLRMWKRHDPLLFIPGPAYIGDDTNSVERILKALIKQALEDAVNEMRIEPHDAFEDDAFGLQGCVRVSFNGKGEEHFLPGYVLKPLVSRLKQLCEMDMADQARVQTGKIGLEREQEHFVLLVTTQPGEPGEGAVVTIEPRG